MRVVGLVGFVLAVLIGGWVIRKQALVQEPSIAAPGRGSMSPGSEATVRTRQVRQDIQRSLDAAVRTSRDVPDEP